MKLKILFLIVLVFSAKIYAQQEQKITVEISLKETTLRKLAKNIPVKVKITNMSDQIFNTADIGGIEFYFSKCPQTKKCKRLDDLYSASDAIKNKRLKKYQSLETEINLADLYWTDPILSVFDTSFPKNIDMVPNVNKYFFADVKIPKGTAKIDDISGEILLNKSFESNEIEVSLLF
jgi:Mor family transcriptional regulator